MNNKGKNIIICCDGTGNQYGERNSNVVKLYSILDKQSPTQIAYYDPGVGTLSDPRFFSPIRKKLLRLLGYAFGAGLTGNIVQAYSYLMEQYEEGDKIFLFGFSRGAYTVRVLAGFIHMCGLLEKGCQNLIPYAWKLYKKYNPKSASGFKCIFTRQCKIHFIGVWDTVGSVGWIHRKKTFPFTANNEDVAIIRHAVSIDERRAYYRTNLWGKQFRYKQNIKEVWFAGVHSDVGGSYPEEEGGLSKIALKWMADEARDFGLHIDEHKYNDIVLGENSHFIAPNYRGMIHKSLRHVWWILEFLPANYTLKNTRFFIPNGKRRTIPRHSLIHQSVIDRMEDNDLNYRPKNLPVESLDQCTIEPYRLLPLTKKRFFDARSCPTLGWEKRWSRLSGNNKSSSAIETRMREGMEIHEKARQCYPGGVQVRERDSEAAANTTAALMNDPGVSIIYGAVFSTGNSTAEADILIRDNDRDNDPDNDKWKWIEVKSGAHKPEKDVHDKYAENMTYVAMIMKQCRVDISQIILLLISRDFRLGKEDADLFSETDCTTPVLSRVEKYTKEWEKIEEETGGSKRPEPEIRIACRGCDIFTECMGRGIQNPIFDIPNLTQSQQKFNMLKEEKIIRIEDIPHPSTFQFKQRQARVINSVQNNKPEIGKNLADKLNAIIRPIYYLDFESIMTAIPLYPDTAPFEQVLTQYSIHKCSKPGKVKKHFQFLANPGKDSRKQLTENLVRDLGDSGSIIVYSNFEQLRIKELMEMFPENTNKLNAILERLVDLEEIIRKEFYHPGFHGKTSIKKTLPVLVKKMSYNKLEIQDGSSAMAIFADMARCRITGKEKKKAQENLLKYCKQDTLAMVKLHQALRKYTR